MKSLVSETVVIENYKTQQSPYKPNSSYHRVLEELRNQLLILSNKAVEDDSYYCYVYLNPLKSGNYKYVLPSGKVVAFDAEPFYVGKGTRHRAYAHLRDARKDKYQQYKHRVIRSIWSKGSTPEVKITKSRVDEYMALAFEIDLIAGIGRKDQKLGPLANLTDGGDGASGGIHVNALTLTYKGRTQSLPKWSREIGINRAILRHRYNMGWSAKRILTTLVAEFKKQIPYEGKLYDIQELALIFNLPVGLIRKRFNRGWKPEEIPLLSLGQRKLVYHDGVGMSIKDWALKTGIAEKILRKRKKRGWEPPKLFQPVRVNTPDGYKIIPNITPR